MGIDEELDDYGGLGEGFVYDAVVVMEGGDEASLFGESG